MKLSDEDLRRALDQHAAGVEFTPDALGQIRRRIRERRGWRRHIPGFVMRPSGGAMFAISTGTGAAVAATVVAVVVGVGSCAPSPTSTTTTHTPATAATTGKSSAPATSGLSVKVPVYYIGSVGGSALLYREYHSVTVANTTTPAQVAAAVKLMLTGNASDPDYASQWPAGASVRSVTISSGVATVDLHGATVNAYDPDGNRAAVQQLIWTATAYSGAKGVRLLFDGKPRATLWKSQQKVGGTLHRAAAVSTLAPVWIIDPQAGATTGAKVTVNLAGIVFEGTIQVRVKDSSGHVVSQKTVQLSVGAPAQGTAKTQFTLSPGKYTMEAYYVSLKDSSIQGLDGHAFTVN